MPGTPADVADAEYAYTAWANQIRDQTVQRFANTGERDATLPNPVRGTFAVTTDTDTLWQAVGSPVVWHAVSPGKAIRCRIYRAGGWSINASSLTVPFDTVDYDPLGMATLGAAAAITVPRDGDYLVTALAGIAGTATGDFYSINILRDGGAMIYGISLAPAPISWGMQVPNFGIVPCSAGNKISIGMGAGQTGQQGGTGIALTFLTVHYFNGWT